jgi:predicted Ser/Thr protein kinase
MIKKKVKIRKKNPFTNTNDVKDYISKNSIYFRWFDDGFYSNVYRFKTDKKLILNAKILNPGEYALKILKSPTTYWRLDEIEYLEKLSKYGVIPKIFIITQNYSISKFIDGYTYSEIKEKYHYGEINEEDFLEINHKIDYLISIWSRLKFNHRDLHDGNILISKNYNKVYFIDPSTL